MDRDKSSLAIVGICVFQIFFLCVNIQILFDFENYATVVYLQHV